MTQCNTMGNVISREVLNKHFCSVWIKNISACLYRKVKERKHMAYLWSLADHRVRMGLGLPPRIKPPDPDYEHCFDFPIPKEYMDAIDKVMERVKDRLLWCHDKSLDFNGIRDLLDASEKDELNELKALRAVSAKKEEAALEVTGGTKDEVIEASCEGEQEQEQEQEMEQKMDMKAIGLALHGTLVVNTNKCLHGAYGILISGPRFCHTKNGKKTFKWYTGVTMLVDPWLGFSGKPTVVSYQMGSRAKSFAEWKFNPDEAGKYKDIADRIAKNIPVVIQSQVSGGQLRGEDFDAGLKNDIDALVASFEEAKCTMSLQSFIEEKSGKAESVAVAAVQEAVEQKPWLETEHEQTIVPFKRDEDEIIPASKIPETSGVESVKVEEVAEESASKKDELLNLLRRENARLKEELHSRHKVIIEMSASVSKIIAIQRTESLKLMEENSRLSAELQTAREKKRWFRFW